jgi:hypothetical protein
VFYKIQLDQNLSKLEPQGRIGQLLGYNDELGSWKILTEEKQILDTKHIKFLEFSPSKPKGNVSFGIDGDAEESEVDPDEVSDAIEPEDIKEAVEPELDAISTILADEDDAVAELLVPSTSD